MIKTVAATSPQDAAQLASLNDALHLVLLEVTELISELCAVLSRFSKTPTRLLPLS